MHPVGGVIRLTPIWSIATGEGSPVSPLERSAQHCHQHPNHPFAPERVEGIVGRFIPLENRKWAPAIRLDLGAKYGFVVLFGGKRDDCAQDFRRKQTQ